MITHLISLTLRQKKEVPKQDATKSGWPWPEGKKPEEKKEPWYAHVFSKKLSKLDYANFINNLAIKKGDILIHQNHVDDGVIPDKEPCWFYAVQDIQEIHQLVDYGPDYEPKCLWLCDVTRKTNGWWATPSQWVKITEENMPKKLRAFLESADADTSNQTKN